MVYRVAPDGLGFCSAEVPLLSSARPPGGAEHHRRDFCPKSTGAQQFAIDSPYTGLPRGHLPFQDTGDHGSRTTGPGQLDNAAADPPLMRERTRRFCR
jgi:hypothetical protein